MVKPLHIAVFIASLFVVLISFYAGWTVSDWKSGKALAEEKATSEKLRAGISAQNAKIEILVAESQAAQKRVSEALEANQQRVEVITRIVEKNAPAVPVTTCAEAMPAVRNILAEIRP